MSLVSLQQPERRSNDLVTEDSAALQFAERYAGSLRYCHDAGRWFEFDGAVWRENTTGVAFQWARELARSLSKEESDRIRYVSSKVSFAAGVERFARFDPVFAVKADFWDKEPFLLGTPGGTIDLRTGQLIAADPNDGISKSTAVTPAIVADCPQWRRFLDEATGADAELIRFLQQFMGYSLSGDVSQHALLFVHGGGGNGKGVFQNTMTRIVGDYARTASMDTFTASRGDRHPTELAMLRGARLVTASETEKGRAWAEARIKAMTGGDPVSARFMRQDFFTYQPQYKLLIVGNHKPVLHNVDDAARRRFNIVPFTRKPARVDPDLERKLKDEWPEILRWMIEGCLDWQKNGLVRPQSVLDATATYFEAQDIVGQFLAEECDFDPGNDYKTIAVGELFSSWCTFAKAAGEEPGTKMALTEILQDRGITRSRTGQTRIYCGVRSKNYSRYA